MDFSRVEQIVIPEGDVKKLSISGLEVWSSQQYEYLEKVYFDGRGMFELPFNITGYDTIYAKFRMLSTSGNLFGYFDGSSSDINFCLYGSSSSYIRYDGGLVRNWDLRSPTGIHDIVFGPTGLKDGGVSRGSWSSKTFTGGHPCVGGLPNSTVAKAKWDFYYFKIQNKCELYPAKRKSDSVVGVYDKLNDVFYTGSYIQENS